MQHALELIESGGIRKERMGGHSTNFTLCDRRACGGRSDEGVGANAGFPWFLDNRTPLGVAVKYW